MCLDRTSSNINKTTDRFIGYLNNMKFPLFFTENKNRKERGVVVFCLWRLQGRENEKKIFVALCLFNFINFY